MSRYANALSLVVFIVFLVLSCGSDPTSPPGSPMNVSGAWEGTWTSSVYSTSGPFTVIITQNGSELGGTIDVPDLNLYGVPLNGTIESGNVAFGDVNDTIEFEGTVGSDTTYASGNYVNSGLSDQGTWSMEIMTGSYVTLVDSIPFSSIFFGTDITAAQGKIWIITSQSILNIDPSSGMLDSVTAPGCSPSGITFDGTDLLVADGSFGADKIFKVDPVNPSVLKAPEELMVDGLAWDGNSFWCLSGQDLSVYQMSAEGDILGSFTCFGEMASGLAFDGTDLWYSSFTGSGKTYIYHVDTGGNLISAFEAPGLQPGGLTFGGTSLWYADGNSSMIYELDTSGSVLSSFACHDWGRDLAWDGTYLWLACDGMSSISRIYCMDTSGADITSIECPGDDPGGLTCDGTYLWNADNANCLVFRLDPAGENFHTLPPFSFDYLAWDGTRYWANDESMSLICSFDEEGNVGTSFSYPCDDVGGLVWHGGSLLVFGDDGSNLSGVYSMSSDGTVLAQYSAFGFLPQPMGAADDGSSLWYFGREVLGTYCLLCEVELHE